MMGWKVTVGNQNNMSTHFTSHSYHSLWSSYMYFFDLYKTPILNKRLHLYLFFQYYYCFSYLLSIIVLPWILQTLWTDKYFNFENLLKSVRRRKRSVVMVGNGGWRWRWWWWWWRNTAVMMMINETLHTFQ